MIERPQRGLHAYLSETRRAIDMAIILEAVYSF
jgi:hypothetical protein